MDDQTHVALPKLYGAPAYARPAVPVAHTTRPFNPDDLPIAAAMTDEERSLLESAAVAGHDARSDPAGGPQPRAFSLRVMADRLRGAGG